LPQTRTDEVQNLNYKGSGIKIAVLEFEDDQGANVVCDGGTINWNWSPMNSSVLSNRLRQFLVVFVLVSSCGGKTERSAGAGNVVGATGGAFAEQGSGGNGAASGGATGATIETGGLQWSGGNGQGGASAAAQIQLQ
jgi:hypothetical protein